MNYTSAVLQVLRERGVTLGNGKPYGAPYIRNIFNGVYENVEIEAAFYEVFKQRKSESDRLAWNKKQMKIATSKSSV